LSVTISIARPAHRNLLRSALLCILPAALAIGVTALHAMTLLGLSAAYLPKVLAVFSVGAALVLLGLPTHHPFPSIGPANQVTVARGVLVALLAGLVGERMDTGAPAIATTVAIIVIVLDGLDGWLARRTHLASGFGARFDMETDALLTLVLSMLAWQFGKAGAWVLLSGLLRYAFVGAGTVLRRLRNPLPCSQRRKSIAVVQMLALVAAIAPFVAPALSVPVTAVALMALIFSFLLDIAWLLQGSTQPRAVPDL